jgi:hypothetical protein
MFVHLFEKEKEKLIYILLFPKLESTSINEKLDIGRKKGKSSSNASS